MAKLQPRILVVGGAGYVGGSVAAFLKDQGAFVWILDDLSTGLREFVRKIKPDGFSQFQFGDGERLKKLCTEQRFDAVFHFGARTLVSESFEKRDEYFENNVEQTKKLVSVLKEMGIRHLVFSSTCAVLGEVAQATLSETLPLNPTNPYGETKAQVEEFLRSETQAHPEFKVTVLRYFNAAGCEKEFRVGERHLPETHLIPRVFRSLLNGKPIEIFGDDYETRDGTCLRDYVHVEDLAQAHWMALEVMSNAPEQLPYYEVFHLGSEMGYTVKEMVSQAMAVSGLKCQTVIRARRSGDVASLVANSEKARRVLGFQAQGLVPILQSAWAWEKQFFERKEPAVFLDRDGTLNFDPGYLSDPAQLKLLDGVGEALARIKRLGFKLIVVSNQSGVGRGIIPLAVLPLMSARLNELLKPFDVEIDHAELCVHHPSQNCECRKPKPTLIEWGAERVGVDLSKSWMVGDKLTDVLAGADLPGMQTALVLTGEGGVAEKELQALKKSRVLSPALNSVMVCRDLLDFSLRLEESLQKSASS